MFSLVLNRKRIDSNYVYAYIYIYIFYYCFLQDKDTWADSVPYLIRNNDVPLLFTSYTKTEAAKDLHAFKTAIQKHQQTFEGSNKLIAKTNQIKIELEMQLNPFRSNRSIRDFEFDNNCDTFYSNQYLTVVRKID